MPLISIIMGTFNGASKISRSIESIIEQTFTDWELIICNDGSTDNTCEVLEEYAKKDLRINIINNEKNSGLAVSLNNCLKKAKGIYIARMDDDDFSHPDRLQKEVDFLINNPEYSIVSTGRNFFDETGVWGTDNNGGPKTNIDVFKGDYFAHPTVLVRKECYDSVDGYSTYPGIGREEDTDLWCKMYAKGYKGYVLNEVLFDYYESLSSMARRKYKYRIAEFKIKMKYRKEMKIPFYCLLFAIKPLVVGVLPNFIVKNHHKKVFAKGK